MYFDWLETVTPVVDFLAIQDKQKFSYKSISCHPASISDRLYQPRLNVCSFFQNALDTYCSTAQTGKNWKLSTKTLSLPKNTALFFYNQTSVIPFYHLNPKTITQTKYCTTPNKTNGVMSLVHICTSYFQWSNASKSQTNDEFNLK